MLDIGGFEVWAEIESRARRVLGGGAYACLGIWLERSRDVPQPSTARDGHADGAGVNRYCRRLVQTAAQPVQSVHPFAGSIFAFNHDDQTRGVEYGEIVAAT